MYDNSDDIYFPRRGVLLSLEGEHTIGIDSGSGAYSRYAAEASWVIPFPRGSMVNPYIKYQGSDNNLPVYDQYRHGSMREFSGYRIDELRGSYSTVMGINTRAVNGKNYNLAGKIYLHKFLFHRFKFLANFSILLRSNVSIG